MKTFRLLASLIVLVSIVATSGCKKEKVEYDPNEAIITINAIDYSSGSFTVFVVFENTLSSSSYIEIVDGENLILRGNSIKGDIINFHFVYIFSGFDNSLGEIISYYEIPIGMEINLPGYASSKSVANESEPKGQTTISFSDIPAFEVATRSALYPAHAHTSASLEVSCANIGGNTFNPGDDFYVCLQNGISAGYKLVSIPQVTDYTISLGELNSDMTKYSYLKSPTNNLDIAANAYNIEGENPIRIYSLDPPYGDLFAGDSINLFVPNGLAQMKKFYTSFTNYDETGLYHSSKYYSNQISKNYSFLNTGLITSHTFGEFPVVTTSNNNYDYIEIRFSFGPVSWTIFAPDGNGLYTPEFPEEVKQVLSADYQLSEFLTKYTVLNVTVTDDSRIIGYEEAYRHHLGIQDYYQEYYNIRSEGRGIFNY